MRQIVRGVWQLTGFPRDLFNIHLMEDVLVDAGTRWAFGRILRQLGKRRLSLVTLTHCHPDHQGAAVGGGLELDLRAVRQFADDLVERMRRRRGRARLGSTCLHRFGNGEVHVGRR